MPWPNTTPLLVNVAAPVPPLVTPNVPEVIALVSIAIDVLLAETIRPFAATLNAATALAEPWSAELIEMLVTSVFAWLKAAAMELFCVVLIAATSVATAALLAVVKAAAMELFWVRLIADCNVVAVLPDKKAASAVFCALVILVFWVASVAADSVAAELAAKKAAVAVFVTVVILAFWVALNLKND